MQISRRQAREWAVQMLTAADLNPPDNVQLFIDEFWQQLLTLETDEGGTDGRIIKGKMREFAEARVMGVMEKMRDIDGVLGPLLENWDLYRLGTIERAVLRLGIWELSYADIPTGAVINEAIDIANWFSSPRSRALINGVLDRYAKSRKSVSV